MSAECPTADPGCGAFGHHHQLLDGYRLQRNLAVDEFGDVIRCPYCDSMTAVTKLVDEDAMFASGEVHATDAARRVLSFENPYDPLQWAMVAADLAKRHQRGDHGGVTPEIVDANRRSMMELPVSIGRIVSAYVVYNERLWVITNPSRTQTLFLLPEEAGATTA